MKALEKYMYAIVSLLYGAFLILLSRLDQRKGFLLARRVIPLFMMPVKKRRHINFRNFFGSQPPISFAEFEKRHLAYQSSLTVESVQLLRIHPKEIRQRVTVVGEEHLHAAMAEGRGALAITTHTGFGWTMMAALSDFGYPVALLSNPTPLRSVRVYTQRFGEHYRIESIWIGNDASEKIRNCFRKNGICLVYYDVAVREKNRIAIPLGSASLPVDLGTAFIGQRYRVPVFRISNTVENNGRTLVTIEPPAIFPGTDNPRKDAATLLEDWVARLSKETAQRPEYWWAWGYVVLDNRQHIIEG